MQGVGGDGIIERVSVSLVARALRRAFPLVLLALAVALALDVSFAEVALAQSTGGSFGGGNFGGGDFGGGGSSGGGYSGGDVEGDEILVFIVHILLSRLPWPLKIALVGLIGGGWVVYKFRDKWRKPKRRGSKANEPEQHGPEDDEQPPV